MLVLLGATGSGKTGITAELHPAACEIVGCDSRQVYREMEIGTACPPPELRARLRHHLVAFLSPAETFSAGAYAGLARETLRDVVTRGKQPVIVGGTGFYYQALRTGLFASGVSQEARARVAELSHEERLEELRRVDPEVLVDAREQASGGRIHPNDEYRVSRALEQYLATGRPWSEHWAEARARLARTDDGEFRFEGWILEPEGDWEAGLLERARGMIAAGLVAEAEAVRSRYGADCPGLRTLGYDLALRGCRGPGDRERLALELARLHRKYALRQRAWFRRESQLARGSRETILRQLAEWRG